MATAVSPTSYVPAPPQLAYMNASVREARQMSAKSRPGTAGTIGSRLSPTRPGTAGSAALASSERADARRQLRARTFIQDQESANVLLPQPLPAGIPYVATFTTYDDLIERRILRQPETKQVHLSTHDANRIFLAKSTDQDLKASWSREVRFLELLASSCRGNTFALREAGLGTAAAEAVHDVLRNNSTFTVLDLSGNRLRDAGTEEIARLVESNTSLVALSLRSVDMGQAGAAALARALETNCTLTTLDLGSMPTGAKRNHIGMLGAKALSQALRRNRVIFELNLSGNGLGPEGVGVLAAGIVFADESVRADGTRPSAVAVNPVSAHVSLSRLSLASNAIGPDGCKVLAAALQTAYLEYLDLRRNAIGEKGAEYIAQAFRHTTDAAGHLATLLLDENAIGPSGAAALASMVRTNGVLKTMTLSKNPLAAGVAQLADALKDNRRLVELDITECSWGPAEAAQLAQVPVAHNSALLTLRCGGNRICDAGATAFATQLALAKKLQTLDLHTCNIGRAGGLALATMLSHNKSLTSLSLRQNLLDPRSGEALQEALRGNMVLRSVDLSFNDVLYASHIAIDALLKRNTQQWEADAAPRLEKDIETLAFAQKELAQIEEDIATVRREGADKHEDNRKKKEALRAQAEGRRKDVEDLQAELATLAADVEHRQQTVSALEEKNNSQRVLKDQRANMLATKAEIEKDRREKLAKEIDKLKRTQKAQQEEEEAQMKPILEQLRRADGDRQAEMDGAKRLAEGMVSMQLKIKALHKALGIVPETPQAAGGAEAATTTTGKTPRGGSARGKRRASSVPGK